MWQEDNGECPLVIKKLGSRVGRGLQQHMLAMDLQISVVGTAMKSSTRQSQMALTTAGTMSETVVIPTQKMLAMLL